VLDEAAVHLVVQDAQVALGQRLRPRQLAQQLETVVPPHEPSRRQLDAPAALGEALGEAALVVVIAVTGRIVHATHVDEHVARRERRSVARAHKLVRAERGQHREHRARERLVAMKMAVVRAKESRRG